MLRDLRRPWALSRSIRLLQSTHWWGQGTICQLRPMGGGDVSPVSVTGKRRMTRTKSRCLPSRSLGQDTTRPCSRPSCTGVSTPWPFDSGSVLGLYCESICRQIFARSREGLEKSKAKPRSATWSSPSLLHESSNSNSSYLVPDGKFRKLPRA